MGSAENANLQDRVAGSRIIVLVLLNPSPGEKLGIPD